MTKNTKAYAVSFKEFSPHLVVQFDHIQLYRDVCFYLRYAEKIVIEWSNDSHGEKIEKKKRIKILGEEEEESGEDQRAGWLG